MINQTQFGVCTWTFGDIPLREIAKRLATMGFDGVELFGGLGDHGPAGYSAVVAAQILNDQGLQVFSLTPDNVDLAHPDMAIRQKAIDYYKRLLDFAVEIGKPLVSCHGFVGRVRPVTTLLEERALLVDGVLEIAAEAERRGLRLVFEVLNRYEAHLINTGAEALALLNDVGAANVGVLLDAYHMNIEEGDPAEALRQVGDRLWLYHAADSNRQALGRGHIDFPAQFRSLAAIGYQGPIIFECTSPGPDPFRAIKNADSLSWLETYLNESRDYVNEVRSV
jgi:sugar phosphate isomerase/epimerase